MANSKQWQVINRLRVGSERRYTLLFRKILNRQIIPVMLSIDEFGVQTTIDKMEFLMSTIPVEKGYEKLYVDVGVSFARISTETVKQADEWIQVTMARAVSANTAITSRITSIVETSRKQALRFIQDELQLGIDQGLGIPEISRNIKKNVPKEWTKMSTFRARRIAQTEVVSASNFGSMQGAQATGLPLNKVWLAGGANIRDMHLIADGESVPQGDKFLNTGEPMDFPGDPSGSAENVINCKCAVAFEVVNI